MSDHEWTLSQLITIRTAERNRARDLAAKLEAQLAAVEALAETWLYDDLGGDRYCAREVLAILNDGSTA